MNWGGVRDQIQMDDDLGGMFGNAYTYDDTLEQSFPANGSLRIVCDRGAINCQPSDGDTIQVVVHKKLYANNQNDANKYNQGSKPIDHRHRQLGTAERQYQWRRRSRRRPPTWTSSSRATRRLTSPAGAGT